MRDFRRTVRQQLSDQELSEYLSSGRNAAINQERTVPLQNRVTPFGEIFASADRGGLMGNRGILHDDRKQLGTARWRTKAWISCVLEWKGQRRAVMSPGRYTELFFLDEATSCAAGHRPCAQCRRRDYNRFVAAWRQAAAIGEGTPVTASVIDTRLHAERVASRTRGKITFTAPLDDLPDGTMVILPDAPLQALLVLGDALLPWSPQGYGAPVGKPFGTAAVLTPSSMVGSFRAGYRPQLHGSAVT
jgi:hypothetical protein